MTTAEALAVAAREARPTFADAVKIAEKQVGPLITNAVTATDWMVAADAVEEALGGPNEMSTRFRFMGLRLDEGRGLVFCRETYMASGVPASYEPTKDRLVGPGVWLDDPLREANQWDWGVHEGNRGKPQLAWRMGVNPFGTGVFNNRWTGEEVEERRAMPSDLPDGSPLLFPYFEKMSQCISTRPNRPS